MANNPKQKRAKCPFCKKMPMVYRRSSELRDRFTYHDNKMGVMCEGSGMVVTIAKLRTIFRRMLTLDY